MSRAVAGLVVKSPRSTPVRNRERRLGRRAFDLRPIDFRELMTWIRYARLQRTVICQQQRSFTVGIEPAGGVDVCDGDVVAERGRPGSGRNLQITPKGLLKAISTLQSAEKLFD